MGLKQNSSNVTYVRFKEGKFFRSQDKEATFGEIEGEIIGLSLADDEFEGRTFRKLIIKMTDGEENFILNLNFDSSYCSNLISFLKNADLSKSLSLVGSHKEGEDGKAQTAIFVKQGGEFMKKFYTKDHPNGLPKMKEVIVNKKKVWDKSEFQEFLENVVLNELAPSTSTRKMAELTSEPLPAKQAVNKEAKEELTAEPEDSIVQVDEEDDMPF